EPEETRPSLRTLRVDDESNRLPADADNSTRTGDLDRDGGRTVTSLPSRGAGRPPDGRDDPRLPDDGRVDSKRCERARASQRRSASAPDRSRPHTQGRVLSGCRVEGERALARLIPELLGALWTEDDDRQSARPRGLEDVGDEPGRWCSAV